jgi:hypothetical protein
MNSSTNKVLGLVLIWAVLLEGCRAAIPASSNPATSSASPTLNPSADRSAPQTDQDLYDWWSGAEYDTASLYSYWTLPTYPGIFGAERLLHHPDALSDQEFIWEYARWNIIDEIPPAGLRPDQDLFGYLVEDLLNNRGVTLDGLQDALNARGFAISQSVIAGDWFGDGIEADFISVRSNALDDDSVRRAVYAVRQVGETSRLDMVRGWEIGSGPSYSKWNDLVAVRDFDGDGQQELLLDVSAGYSGDLGGCTDDYYLYQWNPESQQVESILHVDLRHVRMDDAVCEAESNFLDLGDGIPRIAFDSGWSTEGSGYLVGTDEMTCPVLKTRLVHRWNGDAFVEESNEMLPPESDLPSCQLASASRALKLNWQDDRAIAIIDGFLSDWPAEIDQAWGPASRDYIKLRQAIWRDLRGESGRALALLGSLANHPVNRDYPFFAQLAADYLQERTSSGFLRACHRGLDEAGAASLDFHIETYGYIDQDIVLASWGVVDPMWYRDVDLSCPLDDAIRTTAASSLHDGSEIRGWLESAGLTVLQTNLIDLDRNGVTEWLVWIDTGTESFQRADLWVFYRSAGSWQAQRLGSYWFDEGEALAPYLVSFRPSGAPGQLLAILEDRGFKILSMPDGSQVEADASQFGVDSLILDEQSGDLIVSLYGLVTDDGSNDYLYRWDAASGTLIEQEGLYDFAGAQAEAERLLFYERNFSKAVSFLEQFLADARPGPFLTTQCPGRLPEECADSYDPNRYFPYLRHLLALSYEMNDQPDLAAQTYLGISQDYPQTGFGQAAKWKLESNPR